MLAEGERCNSWRGTLYMSILGVLLIDHITARADREAGGHARPLDSLRVMTSEAQSILNRTTRRLYTTSHMLYLTQSANFCVETLTALSDMKRTDSSSSRALFKLCLRL